MFESFGAIATLCQFAFFILQVVFFVYGILAFRKYLGHGTRNAKTQEKHTTEEA